MPLDPEKQTKNNDGNLQRASCINSKKVSYIYNMCQIKSNQC